MNIYASTKNNTALPNHPTGEVQAIGVFSNARSITGKATYTTIKLAAQVISGTITNCFIKVNGQWKPAKLT